MSRRGETNSLIVLTVNILICWFSFFFSRMKTELMIQMDGVKGSSTVTEQVFVMAASNLPWDLDVAVLRRWVP
jgi:SpoVK/Ycf46/Vps4 family AAA+-type ATPase